MKAVSGALQAELVALFFVCFNDRFLFFNGIQNFRLFEMIEFVISTEVLSHSGEKSSLVLQQELGEQGGG